MDKVRLPNSAKVYLPLATVFLILLFLMPKSGKFNYDYRKGSTWLYETLVAQFDFPILKTDEELKNEKMEFASMEVPYYKHMTNIPQEAVKAMRREADFSSCPELKPVAASALANIYDRGLVGTSEGLSENATVFIRKNNKATKYPISELYTIETARIKLAEEIEAVVPDLNADSLCVVLELYKYLVPNLVYDQETTDLIHKELYESISPTSGFVNAGQVIVTKGEVITAETVKVLDSYKAEYQNTLGYKGPAALQWLGNGLLALALVFVLFLTIYYTNFRIFEQFNKYLYLLMIFTIAALAALVTDNIKPGALYMVPFTLIALYLLAFFKKRVVVPVYIISLLPLLIFCHNGLELFVMFLVAGIVSIFSFHYFHKGWQQFVTAFFAFLALLLVNMSFRLISGNFADYDYQVIMYLALGSLFTVAGYPLIFLFEKIYALVSNSKLIELTDNNNKLLRELAQKAPGTFQHSLQVMNMVDAVARSVDANVLLMRAGAMYHDVGKISNPQCFVENAAPGMNYHKDLSPKESAAEIIKHVHDGLVIADKYNLPAVVKEFIVTHHGTSCTAYFYNKYVNEGGDPNDIADFTYDGVKPVTKEQVIMMLCDSIEAASRTLHDYSTESISAFVEGMVKSKMDQFDNSEISLKELATVKDVIKSYLAQAHHMRVAYPKRRR